MVTTTLARHPLVLGDLARVSREFATCICRSGSLDPSAKQSRHECSALYARWRGIIFRAWQEPQQERQSLWIAVQDNGAGIAPEALPHIFDRFYRADSARSNGSESGLGLAVAKSIIEAHGGSIRANSQPSKGTQIQICLPLNKPS